MSALARLRLQPRIGPWLQQRFLRWIQSRRGPASLPFILEYRNIYVLPTLFGAAFGVMLIFTALGGLNFNNNMALMLVFTLGVIAQLTTVLAYRNLVALRLESIAAAPVFSGEQAIFRAYLANPEDRPRLAVQAGFGELSDCADLKPLGNAGLSLSLPTHRRGWLTLPPFKLETRYPLGLFRAWTWFFPSARCLVYPRPADNPPPLPRMGFGRSGKAIKGDGEQLHGLREYRPGDPLMRVAWRTSARHDELYTREMETPREQTCELSWQVLAGIDPETRLQILTRWVLQAEALNLPYRLEMPGTKLGPALGDSHRAACLEALALFDP